MGSWWCLPRRDLPLAGAHPAPVCRAPGCRRRRRSLPLAVLPGRDLWWLAPVGVALLAGATLTAGARRGALLGLLGGLAFFVPVLSWSGVYVGALPWFALATLEALYVAAMSAVVGYAGRRLTAAGRTGTAYLLVPLAWVVQEWARGSHPLRRVPVGATGVQPGRQPAGPRRSLARRAGRDLRRRRRRHAAPGSPRSPRPCTGPGHVPRWPRPSPSGSSLLAPAGLAAAHRRARRCRSGSCRATCRRPAWTSTPSAGPCSTTTSAAPSGSPRSAPDDLSLVVWPENSSDIDPFRNPDAAAQIDGARRAVGVPLLIGAVLAEPPGHSVERLAVLPARGRRAPALRQAAPGALRRVHPEPGLLPDVHPGGRPRGQLRRRPRGRRLPGAGHRAATTWPCRRSASRSPTTT